MDIIFGCPGALEQNW